MNPTSTTPAILQRLALTFSLAALGLAAVACGQGPSFLQDESTRHGAGGALGDPDATPGSGDALPAEGGGDGEDGGGEAVDPSLDPSTDPEPSDEEPPLEIPDAGDKDLGALHKCLAKWKNHPFKGRVDNFHRLSASVTVGGMGNAINDNESTEEPFLVLIDAGVNVLGTPTYNLMNRNGYYCMKVNVNVMTALTVNLHCNARLADQKVNVNVGSSQNDSTSTVGVHVLSNVQVNTVRPEGASCIR